MQIDWFTFVAQVVNFLILLYLLRRFLYGPILRAVDARQQKIRRRIEEAEETREEAREEAERYRRERRELEQGRDELLGKARQDAEERRSRLMEEVRADVEEARERWRGVLERERSDYLEDLRRRLGERVFHVSRRVLRDLADEELEERVLEVFLERLDAEVEPQGEEAPWGGAGPVRVRSSFEIPGSWRRRIVERLGEGVEVEFEVDPEVVCGIELRAQGVRTAWSVDDYLESLEALFFSGEYGEEAATSAPAPGEEAGAGQGMAAPAPEEG